MIIDSEKIKAFGKFLLTSIVVYFLIIFGFSYYYGKNELIRPTFGTKGDTTKVTNFDNTYFSFIVFHTIGFGDFIPNTDKLAKKIIWLEAIVSIIFHTLFSGFLIRILLRRFPQIIVSDFILLSLNDRENQSLAIRFGNFGDNVWEGQAVIEVYELKNINKKTERKQIIRVSKKYHTVLKQTTYYLRFDLTTTKERREFFKENLIPSLDYLCKSKDKGYKSLLKFIFYFKGIDEKTGDFIAISKSFSEKEITFGDDFDKVVRWISFNPDKKEVHWNNFNSIINEIDCTKFLESNSLLEN